MIEQPSGDSPSIQPVSVDSGKPGSQQNKWQPRRIRLRWLDWLRRALAVACWSYLLVLICLWVLLMRTDDWWPATILAFAPRWLFTLPLAFFLPAALCLRRRSLVPVFAAGLVVAGPVTGFNIPWQRLFNQSTAAKPLRLMTINMHYSRVDGKALEDLITRENPDVIVLQEGYGAHLSRFNADHTWHVHSAPKMVIVSRYPIRGTEEIGTHSTGEHAAVQRYELETPDGLVQLFSLHTASLRTGIYHTIHENQEGPMEVQENSQLRREQLDYVVSRASAFQGPVLIAGDFNTPPESTIFDGAWREYTNAFTAGGWGCGYTFFGAKTMVRIDHIMAGKGWTCAGCRVGPNIGSPHRPVIADLIWSGPNTAVR